MDQYSPIIRSLTMTVVMETEAFPLPTNPELLLVHTLFDDGNTGYVFMKKADYERATKPTDIVNYTFTTDGYPARFVVLTDEQFARHQTGVQWWNDHKDTEDPIKFGEPLPPNAVVMGYCMENHLAYDLNEKLLNFPVMDFYLDRDYDIRALVENEKNNPDVIIHNGSYGDDPIYYVPGNGDTVNLALVLPDDVYTQYVSDRYLRQTILNDFTILGKYKRSVVRDWAGFNTEDDEE